jgi:hypothetical protein
MALADAGFREAAQLEYSKAVWVADDVEPEPSGMRRLVYRFDADDENEAMHKARDVVGERFNIRVTVPPAT